MLNLLSLLFGLIALPIMLIGLVPAFGILNYVVIFLTVIGTVLGSVSEHKSGRNLNLIVLVIGGFRLWLGFGFL